MVKDFEKKEILELAKKIFESRKICLNCLGRQFAQVSTGLTNKKRGEILLNLLKTKEKSEKCEICNDLFKNLDFWAERAVKKLKNKDFKTFLVGTKLSPELIKKEEELWEDFGIEYCEPIKAEINRELGKLIEKKMKKKFDRENPDIVIILNLKENEIEIESNPLFIYGKYKKLVRGIPQTKWDMYKETIEDIIAKPIMKVTKGKSHSMHASGREDIDARCLDWRPFVFEIEKPEKRNINLKEIQKEINKTKKIKVKDLRFCNKKEVREVKLLKPDKTYKVVVKFKNPVKNIEKVKEIIGEIKQKTPTRVLHRRADKLRKRKVKEIDWKKINNKKFEFKIRGEAGLYIKELITGDGGRTKPSISEILNNQAEVESLDVIKIWVENEKE